MNKGTIVSIIIAIVLIGGAAFLVGGKDNSQQEVKNNVTIVDGKQIIEISAKGGYAPRITTAKANMPTVIKVNTQGTFDCSSALTIPSIGYKTNLPVSGNTDIEVPAQKAGTTLQGICSMGMYNFSVNFI
ncbi:MAG: cupredoxin domain-containing protein [bacterium]|nr:cupredoxin domain-containing protein [bacterium]